MNQNTEDKQLETDCLDLSGEAIMIAREQFEVFCGVETAFFDDVSRLVAVLASRAILAGLHSDLGDQATRERMERAAEFFRDAHEGNLGFPIPSHPSPTRKDEAR